MHENTLGRVAFFSKQCFVDLANLMGLYSGQGRWVHRGLICRMLIGLHRGIYSGDLYKGGGGVLMGLYGICGIYDHVNQKW